MALFLFSVSLPVAVFSLVGGPFTTSDAPRANREAAVDIARERGQLDRRIADLQRRRGTAAAQRQPTAAIDAELRILRQQRAGLDAAEIVLVPSNAPEGTPRTIDLRGEGDTGWRWRDQAIEKAGPKPSRLLLKAYNYVVVVTYSIQFIW